MDEEPKQMVQFQRAIYLFFLKKEKSTIVSRKIQI
jgi:hypothetical protein